MMKTILVAGGSGFLGGHICQHFSSIGWRVVSIGRGHGCPSAHDHFPIILPHPRLSDVLRLEKPALMVNCAGRSSVAMSVTDPLGDFRASSIVGMECLEAIRTSAPGCAFIALSSASVYGNPPHLPVSETHPTNPVSPYGYHKRMEELGCEEYARLHGVRTAALRIFSAYGGGLHRQVVWDLTRKIIQARGAPIRILGTGQESRDFIHGRDVASAVETVYAKSALHGEVINLATGQEIFIRDLAATIQAVSGVDSELRFDGRTPEGYSLRWHADVSLLAELGFEPTVGLERGVAEVCSAVLNKA